jgi:hypothetical protein
MNTEIRIAQIILAQKPIVHALSALPKLPWPLYLVKLIQAPLPINKAAALINTVTGAL